jgi:hypothetical protein
MSGASLDQFDDVQFDNIAMRPSQPSRRPGEQNVFERSRALGENVAILVHEVELQSYLRPGSEFAKQSLRFDRLTRQIYFFFP